MVRPMIDEADLQNLDKTDLEKLRPEFYEQVLALRKQVLGCVKVKAINKTQISGEIFTTLMQQYVDAINVGSVPNIENTWHYICQVENQKAAD